MAIYATLTQKYILYLQSCKSGYVNRVLLERLHDTRLTKVTLITHHYNMKKISLAIIILVLITGGYYFLKPSGIKQAMDTTIKLGVLTDLTGPASYWGASTQVGINLAIKELESEQIRVTPIFEDYQLNATKAATAAQKLSTLDKVDAMYVDLNIGAITAGSILQDKNILYVYDAAVESPLASSPTRFKTYLDFKGGCQAMATQFKNNGVKTIGILKVSSESGELCAEGVKSVFGENAVVESYNLGDTDFRTQLLKFKSKNVQAFTNVGFEGDILNTLSAMKQSNFKVPFGTVTDSITSKVTSMYGAEMKGSLSFGFSDVDQNLVAKLVKANGGRELSSNYGAALGYVHTKQIARALATCKKEITCTSKTFASSGVEKSVGFQSFAKNIAQFTMEIKKY